MSQESSHTGESGGTKSLFQATRWSLILSIGQGDTVQATPAREEVCRTYWQAIYGYIRWRGYGKEEAQDLTQDFWAHLLHKNGFKGLDPRKGRFRAFLLTALKNFLANVHDFKTAQKRNPGAPLISLDDAEQKHQSGVRSGWTEDMVFDRHWAMAIVDRAMNRLREIHQVNNEVELFEAMKDFLARSATDGEYDKIAARFGMQNKALAMRIRRMRKAYGELVRAELRQTVEDDKDLEEELRYLIEVISR